jgi:hypothetical protein
MPLAVSSSFSSLYGGEAIVETGNNSGHILERLSMCVVLHSTRRVWLVARIGLCGMVRLSEQTTAGITRFHSLTCTPLLPPQSAVIVRQVAPGYRARPSLYHQRRMLSTAKAAVSASMPTLTQP